MYCDFCGKKLYYNVNYCRHCGQLLKGRSEDTNPLPVIDDTKLNLTKRPASISSPWANFISKLKTAISNSQLWRRLYGLVSLTVLVSLIYILSTFKTIGQYQILTVTWGSLVVIYTWIKR